MATFQHQFKAMASTFALRIDLWTDEATQDDIQRIPDLLQELENSVHRMESIMSRFRTDSELVQLMKHIDEPQTVSAPLFEVLQLAQKLVTWTDGAFDPRVLSVLEEIGYRGAPLVAEGGSVTSPSVNSSSAMAMNLNSKTGNIVEITGSSTVRLHAPIDLGGIGKGYTADYLAQIIDERIHPQVLAGYIVDAGGDVVIAGCQHNWEPWSIGIEHPLAPSTLCAVVSPTSALETHVAICTSSLWRKTWQHQGKPVHHLIDPQTGMPTDTPLLSVTAIGQQAAVTEVVTKFVFLRGVASAELWQHVPQQFLWITQEGKLGMTDAFQPFVTWLSTPE